MTNGNYTLCPSNQREENTEYLDMTKFRNFPDVIFYLGKSFKRVSFLTLLRYVATSLILNNTGFKQSIYINTWHLGTMLCFRSVEKTYPSFYITHRRH